MMTISAILRHFSRNIWSTRVCSWWRPSPPPHQEEPFARKWTFSVTPLLKCSWSEWNKDQTDLRVLSGGFLIMSSCRDLDYDMWIFDVGPGWELIGTWFEFLRTWIVVDVKLTATTIYPSSSRPDSFTQSRRCTKTAHKSERETQPHAELYQTRLHWQTTYMHY